MLLHYGGEKVSENAEKIRGMAFIDAKKPAAAKKQVIFMAAAGLKIYREMCENELKIHLICEKREK